MSKTSGNTHWKDSLAGKLLVRFWLSLLLFSLIMGAIQYQALHQFLMKGEAQDLQAQIGLFNAKQVRIWLSHRQLFPMSWPGLAPGVVVSFFSPDREFEAILKREKIKSENTVAAQKAFFIRQVQKKRLRTSAILTIPKGIRYLVLSGPIYLNQATVTSVSGQNSKVSPADTLIGYAALSEPLTQINNILYHQFQVLLVSTLFILVFSGLLTFYILRKPLQPLSRMSEISGKIAAGNYTLRIPEEPSTSEIAHLRSVLNHMLETLNKSLAAATEAKEQMTRFIADASHELRTPLTSIRGFLEILLRSQETDAQTLTSAHATMLGETERLIRLTEDLLTLNRLTKQAGQESGDKPETSVQAVFPELLPLLNSLLAYRTLDIQVGELSLPVEAGELKQVIYNLIHNAIQHTPVNGRIAVKTGTDNEEKYLSVTDDGEGISPRDLPYVFERFYRGSRSRERKTGSGAGLGLSIVWEIINLRGGRIDCQSLQGESTTFTVFFPK